MEEGRRDAERTVKCGCGCTCRNQAAFDSVSCRKAEGAGFPNCNPQARYSENQCLALQFDEITGQLQGFPSSSFGDKRLSLFSPCSPFLLVKI